MLDQYVNDRPYVASSFMNRSTLSYFTNSFMWNSIGNSAFRDSLTFTFEDS